MKWLILGLAGLLEVVWAIGLKYSQGFTKPWPSVITAAAMIGSVVLLGIAMKQLPVGIAYGIWTACGVALVAIIAKFLFSEPLTPVMMLGIALIVSGVFTIELAGIGPGTTH